MILAHDWWLEAGPLYEYKYLLSKSRACEPVFSNAKNSERACVRANARVAELVGACARDARARKGDEPGGVRTRGTCDAFQSRRVYVGYT